MALSYIRVAIKITPGQLLLCLLKISGKADAFTWFYSNNSFPFLRGLETCEMNHLVVVGGVGVGGGGVCVCVCVCG